CRCGQPGRVGLFGARGGSTETFLGRVGLPRGGGADRFGQRSRELRIMKKHLPVAVAALAGLVLTTACGSGGGPVADGEMPVEIEIVSVTDKTGLTAFGGQPQFRGIELAVEQINEQDYLDGSRISLRSR